jgi:hypothetical protein
MHSWSALHLHHSMLYAWCMSEDVQWLVLVVLLMLMLMLVLVLHLQVLAGLAAMALTLHVSLLLWLLHVCWHHT